MLSCQNDSERNTNPEFRAALKAKGLSIGDDGGLFYVVSAERSDHKAGTRKILDREVIQSYGAMTYDGIKTYLYAGLSKDDPKVKAAVDWVRKNYTVEAHPGFVYDKVPRNKYRGIYYYYLVMTRALHAYGERPFKTFNEKLHDWPVELGEKLLETVKESKTWVNDENPAWYEGDPVLTTSYVLTTLDIIIGYVQDRE